MAADGRRFRFLTAGESYGRAVSILDGVPAASAVRESIDGTLAARRARARMKTERDRAEVVAGA
jgi:chorismate synthase